MSILNPDANKPTNTKKVQSKYYDDAWRRSRPTDKQVELITKMELKACPLFDFDNATKGDACKYISEHMDLYREQCKFMS